MDELSAVKKIVEKDFESFESYYSSLLITSNPLLNRVLSYLQQSNGKMLRPLLVLMVAKSLGTVSANSFRAAASAQVLHTASLLHDDVVDESPLRHGSASINSAFDNKIAVLVGDYLLSSALHQVALTCNTAMIQTVSDLGISLSDGELLQLSSEYRASLSEELYFEVIRNKTAIFFAACASLGAMSVNSSDEIVEKFRLFGESIGLCFQIRDDILDYQGNLELGKPTGSDIREGKLTLPAILAINRYGNPRTADLISRLKTTSLSDVDVQYLIDFTVEKGGIEAAQDVMELYCQKALSQLPETLDDEFREAFCAFCSFFIHRKT